jgi:hypothetical protein
MAYSQVTVPGDGVTTLITVNFALGFIEEGNVTCRVGDESTDREITFSTPTLIQVSGAPAALGENYVFSRTVDADDLIVNWEDGNPITGANLNLAQKQSLMLTHQALDQLDRAVKAPPGTAGIDLGTIVPGTVLVVNDAGDKLVAGPTVANVAAAEGHAQTALTQAGVATAQATVATNEANRAATEADEADVQAGIATTKAVEAADSATLAGTHAATAGTHASTASTAATTATTQAGVATTKATEAASSATTATTQAGIATTQAGLANDQRVLAEAAAADAVAAAAGAGGDGVRLTAVADGNGTGGGTDIKVELQALIDATSSAGGGTVTIPKTGTGIYRMTAGAVYLKSNVTVKVAAGVKFDRTSCNDHAVRCDGSAAIFRNTQEHKTRGDTLIEMSSAHDFVIGDLVQIVGQRNALSVDAGDWRCGNGTASLNYAYFGEWLEVAGVPSSTNFTSATPLMFPDYRTNVTLETDTDRTGTQVRKMSPVVNAHWLGGEFINIGNYGAFYGHMAAYCTFEDAVVVKNGSAGGTVQWSNSLRCWGKNISHVGNPALAWDYDTMHGTMNHYKTISTQDCGFIGCYDEYAAQSFDLTYGGPETPYLVNVRSKVLECENYRCFEGSTSHPGCYQEQWVGNSFRDCLRNGIIVRGLEATVTDNEFTSSSELLTTADAADYSVGVDLYNGYAKGALIQGNTVHGFRFAFRARDGSTDSRFTNVDALIHGNRISECYGGLTTDFSEVVVTDTPRGIVYKDNIHRRMQRYMVNLARYSPGCIIHGNVLHGDFVNTGDASSVYAILAGQDCPALDIQDNVWYRTSIGNSGKTLRMVTIGSITDETTFPEAAWGNRTLLRNNMVTRAPTFKYGVNNSTYQQNDDFSDADGATSKGATGGMFAGVYTPVLTNSTNVAASTAFECQYVRVGPVVFVNGTVQIDATTADSQLVLSISLPIASDIAASTDAAGTFASSAANSGGRIVGDVSNNRVNLIGVPSSNANLSYGFSFSYRIK